MQVEYQMAVPSRRFRPAKKSSWKKRLVAMSIALAVILTSAQVYAAALGTDIITLITNGINNMTTDQKAVADTQSQAIETSYTTELQQAVVDKKSDAARQLAEYTQQEMKRVSDALTEYLNGQKEEMNSVVDPKVDAAKQQIKSKVDTLIGEIEGRMDTAFQKKLTEVWGSNQQ